MARRIIEIIVGLAIGGSLFISYSDASHDSKFVIWYLLTPQVLQIVAWITLFFLASRLVYGKYKDYSKYFYDLFNRLFGDNKKIDNRN